MKALVVGLGSAGTRHAENLLAAGLDEIVACSEWRKLQQVSVRDRKIEVLTDYSVALARRPDVVFIANPTSLHISYLEKAVVQGCHVYVEKPLAASSRGLANTWRVVTRSKAVVAVGNQLRFNECLERAKTALKENVVGKVLHVHVDMGEYLPAYHPNEDYRTGYAARSDLGGGVLSTQIHDINYLHWLFGPFQQVSAIGGKISELEIDVEDSVSFLAKTAAGPITVHLDYLQRKPRRTMIVTGERGTLTWDYHLNTLTLSDAEGPRDIGPGTPLVRNDMFTAAISDFLACIRTGAQPRTGFREGMMDVVIVDAVRSSFTSDRAVSVNYDLN